MTTAPVTADFYGIVTQDVPLIDVRAPVEFGTGSFPTAVNLPVLDDEDRHCVGVCYKQRGREAAFDLAYNRVGGNLRQQRIAAWMRYHKEHPNAVMYCFRGGMRSTTAQQWFMEVTGAPIVRLQGGYKALRRYLLETLSPDNVRAEPVVLGGRTGVGKTVLLNHLPGSIDLEGLAHHRGSTFGAHLSPQPSQIDFENRLACALIKHRHKGFSHIFLEDEGNYIGGRYIPHELAGYFKRDSMVLLESPLAQRVKLTYEEYVLDAQRDYERMYGREKGVELWLDWMHSRMYRIRKRLGGERLKRVVQLLDDAHGRQCDSGEAGDHRRWIELLLTEYYDPMYDYQIIKSGRTIDFQGGFAEVLEYLQKIESRNIPGKF
ncbi:MAG: tRNA 2-selenouridine(34) synthase MnmH [Desulfopila sp.]